MRKLNQEDYINKCIEIHNGKYDYSLTEYKNNRSKVKIICSIHGIFEQISKNHKEGQGCPNCSGNNTLTKNEFIEICKKIHDNKYDYSLIDSKLIKNEDFIKVINKVDNMTYLQLAHNHKKGFSPSKIESDSLVKRLSNIHNNRYRYFTKSNIVKLTERIKLVDNLTNDEFLYRVDRHLLGMRPNKVTLNLFKLKSKEIHKDKYDYSLINEISGNKDTVEIICTEHGIFKQKVSNHMNLKDGCPKCIGKGLWNNELLISEFKKIHFDIYDYSKLEFINISTKIKIICKEHGEFEQNIYKHLSGQGCKLCKSTSKGEEYIKLYLEKMKIKYIRQHGFDTCKYINKLNFDFYLPELNTCIEFDGIQHFKPIKEFGGDNEFNNVIKRDESKNKWCLENSVKLIRIRYDEINKINEILNNELLYVI